MSVRGRHFIVILSLIAVAGLAAWLFAHTAPSAKPSSPVAQHAPAHNSPTEPPAPAIPQKPPEKAAAPTPPLAGDPQPAVAANEKSAWPRWGGALNSADAAGHGFFDRATAAKFKASVDAPLRRYVVELNARSFLPATSAQALAQPGEVFSKDDLDDPNAARTIYMQFTQNPNVEQRAMLGRAGVTLDSYSSSYTWTASGTTPALAHAGQFAFVRAVARIDPRDKLNLSVYHQQTPAYAQTPDGLTRFSVLALPGTTLDAFKSDLAKTPELAALPVKTRAASVLGPRFEVVARANQAATIAASGLVAFVEHVPPPIANRDAITDSSSNVSLVRDNGPQLTGTGVTVAVREIGMPESHMDFISRLNFIQSNGDSSDPGNYQHATAVTGQVASSGVNQPSAKGCAPNVNVLIYSTADAVSVLDDAFNSADIIDAGARGARVSNHSYGPLVTMWGDYETVSADWDAAIQANNLNVFLAGNEEDDNTVYTHIDFFVGMKNGICVEAANSAAKAGNPLGTPPTSAAPGIAAFAKYGPMDDGRVKPDLVAWGGDGTPTGNFVTLDVGTDSVQQADGTSFATPACTGIAALELQYYKTIVGVEPSSALMKAILCETASNLGFTGPSAVYGFGIINAQAAVALTQLRVSPTITPFVEGSLGDGQSQTFMITVPSGTPLLKATLCWMDVAGTPGAAKALVNDLDMLLTDPNGITYYPYSLDPNNPMNAATNTGPNTVDPIEQTIVSSPAAGIWTVTISGSNVPSGPQAFAFCSNLIVTQSLVAVATASPTMGTAPLDVSFSAANSVGSIASYQWDFGDGTTGSGVNIVHTYVTVGTFTAVLTITGTQGQTATFSIPNIVVLQPSNVPLVAVAHALPTSGEEPLLVTFSAAGSTGNIVQYLWFFDDNGATATGATVTHTYNLPVPTGGWNPYLVVTDLNNNTATAYTDPITDVVKKLQTDVYPLLVTGRASFSKSTSNELQLTMIVPSLVLTPQQARDAVRDGTFEGTTYTVRAGLLTDPTVVDRNFGTQLRTFLLNRQLSDVESDASFQMALSKGTITMRFKNSTADNLLALFQGFGIGASTTTLPFTIRVQVETAGVIYQSDYKVNYKGSKGTGTLKGGSK